MLLGPIGLHKASSPRTGNVIGLLNIYSKHRELGKMRRERNKFQMKEQGTTSGKKKKKLKVEISNLSYKEFKAMDIKILNKLRKRMDGTVIIVMGQKYEIQNTSELYK